MKIAIVGAGKLGVRIAETLLGGDHSVTIIDKDEALLARLGSFFDIMTVAGNGKQIELLNEIDIDTYDFLIATTDRDEKNIVIASFAKKMGCAKVIARVRDPEHMKQIEFIKETMNIDYITNPDLAITQEIYKFLVEKYTLSNGIFSTGMISLLEFLVDNLPGAIGKKLSDIKAILGEVQIVAISRCGKVIIPEEDIVTHEDDTIYVVGEKSLIAQIGDRVFEKGRYTDLQKVMIAGGGKTGLYLSKMLSEFGVSVKIIEKNKDRCQYLSLHLDDVLILNGDATDVDLLEEENFEEMDAFVSATGYDEENLLLALMAKKEGIEDVIAKISRDSYTELIESMGIDMALNPVDISASHVLRYMQGTRLVLTSQLIQGQAEMIEIIADDDMRLIDKKIRNINLPGEVIIAAIQRGIEVIIPKGNTEVEEGDKVIIFSLLSEVEELEKLLRTRHPGFFR